MGKFSWRRKLFWKLVRWTGIAILALIVLSWLPVVAFRWIDPPTSAFMLREALTRQPPRYEWTDWDDIHQNAALAVVAAEDQRFAEHSGFDFESIRESVAEGLTGGEMRGASTISQQVSKNLFLWPGRSFARKGLEAYFTVLIELTWPKQRILEVYLNIAEFGSGVFGVGAASDAFFGKPASDLGSGQAALLASVLPNPKSYRVDRPSAYVRRRQAWIMGQMARLRVERWLASIN